MENKKELIVKDRHGVEHNLYDLPKNFVFDGDIDLSGSDFKELPDLSTITVTGSFSCKSCDNLITLKGAPEKVGGYFLCNYCNNLTSLEGAPQEVGGYFFCNNCENLVSLKGAPKQVNNMFACSDCNNLTSLEGAPQEVDGRFDCQDCNKLVSLKGAPKVVVGDFICSYCENLTSLEGAPQKVGGCFDCVGCKELTSLKGAPNKVGDNFYCGCCDNLKSLLHVSRCREIDSDYELLHRYAPGLKEHPFVGTQSLTYARLMISPLYNIERANQKVREKLANKHQDGEKTAPKEQVATTVNTAVLKAKESRDI